MNTAINIDNGWILLELEVVVVGSVTSSVTPIPVTIFSVITLSIAADNNNFNYYLIIIIITIIFSQDLEGQEKNAFNVTHLH